MPISIGIKECVVSKEINIDTHRAVKIYAKQVYVPHKLSFPSQSRINVIWQQINGSEMKIKILERSEINIIILIPKHTLKYRLQNFLNCLINEVKFKELKKK